MEKHLHIISLDVPWPVNYGGVYDLFYKLPALQSLGVKIHLHCFDNGRGEQTELNKYCEEVFYYKRNTGHKGFSTSLPYIVTSRKNELLMQNLLKDDYPIFMEGVHCTYITHDPRFAGRKKFVRIHNVEHEYYRQLYKCSHHFGKKTYYWWESHLLHAYEKKLTKNATAFWAVTENDTSFYRSHFHCNTIDYLPLFIPPWQVTSKEGIGGFCLYHGDLSVDANEFAARWLLKNVFANTDLPLVIAGKNPTKALEDIVHENINTCIVSNPSEKELQDLITKAQVNILPSFHNSGIKIKLLNALYNGRHCVVNKAMVDGTGLEQLCYVADSAEAIKSRLEMLYHAPFTFPMVQERKAILQQHFNNEKSAKQMVHWIWTQYA